MTIDVSTEKARHEFYCHNRDWERVRLKALKRDHYSCVNCKAKGILTTSRLEVDHIQELEYHPELALELDNLRTLCKDCHNKRHNRYQRTRKQWDDERFDW